MRIDAHHHFIDPNRFRYPWMQGDWAELYREFSLREMRPHLERHRIDHTVLVQTISSVAETQAFLDLATAEPVVAGVVGWADLTDPRLDCTLESLTERGPLVGIRHQVHDEADDQWLARSDVRRGLAVVAQRGLVYDLLIRPQHLGVSLELARSMPNLVLVVDHIAKPDIRGGAWERWAEGLAELARCPNVHCKLSGMVTEADWATGTVDEFVPYARHTLEVFSPQRVLFGSDWPVCLLAGGYDRALKAAEHAVNAAGLSASERKAVFGDTAASVYRLGQR